jgi:hypothetical protein
MSNSIAKRLTLYSEMNFSWGKRSLLEWCVKERKKERKKWNGVVSSRGVAFERNKEKQMKEDVSLV